MNLLDSARKSNSLETITAAENNHAEICSFTEATWEFDYFYYANGKKHLNVLFPSALVRGKRMVPSFYRWSWSPLFPDADVLCISDPTLRLDPEILGGWFQGKDEDWVLLRTLRHIRFIQQKFDYRRVTFCGSSLGGFAALQAGILAPSVGFAETECRVFSENPQISLPRYMFKSHMQKLAQVSYSVDDINSIPEYAQSRLDVVRLMRQHNHVPRGLVVVKESDVHHHQVHVNYLRENIPGSHHDCLKIEVIPSSVDASGHTALNIEEMLIRMNSIDLKTAQPSDLSCA